MSRQPPKRDNEYYIARLRKDGHDKILKQVEAGDITVYRASQLAGYRKKGKKAPAALLSHHWQRGSHGDRKRFVIAHALEIDRVLKEIAREVREKREKHRK